MFADPMSLTSPRDILNFSPDEIDHFFDQLAFRAEASSKKLGNQAGADSSVTDLAAHLREMKQEIKRSSASFSPVLGVTPLNRRLFKVKGIALPDALAQELKKYQFALINIPITLVPARGWGFNALDCLIEFNPGQAPEQLPLAYEIFPSEVWQTVFTGSQHLTVGLNEFFHFYPSAVVPLVADAGVKLDVDAGASMKLGEFKYDVSLPKVVARGSGSSKVRWVLEGKEFVERKELKMAVVAKIPKGTSQVTVLGVMTVRRYFASLFAPIQYLIETLQDERAKAFFKLGAPIKPLDMIWDISNDL